MIAERTVDQSASRRPVGIHGA